MSSQITDRRLVLCSLAGLAWPDSGRAGPCWWPLSAASRR